MLKYVNNLQLDSANMAFYNAGLINITPCLRFFYRIKLRRVSREISNIFIRFYCVINKIKFWNIGLSYNIAVHFRKIRENGWQCNFGDFYGECHSSNINFICIHYQNILWWGKILTTGLALKYFRRKNRPWREKW